MFILLTFLFNQSKLSQNRLEEIYYCLTQNKLNPHIKSIKVLCDKNFNLKGKISKFLKENNIKFENITLESFRDIIAYGNENLYGENVILSYPDILIPLNSGIGSLNTIDLKKICLTLTPYSLINDNHIDNVYTGVVRQYCNKTIKLHGINGSSISSWIFNLYKRFDPSGFNSKISGLNIYENPDNIVFSKKLEKQFKIINNPSLEIVSIKVFKGWHPKNDYAFKHEEKDKEFILPCLLKEIGSKVSDSSKLLDFNVVQFQTRFYNGSKIVNLPLDQLKNAVDFNYQKEIAKTQLFGYTDKRTSDNSLLSSRLLHPQKVASTFLIAKQKGRLLLKTK